MGLFDLIKKGAKAGQKGAKLSKKHERRMKVAVKKEGLSGTTAYERVVFRKKLADVKPKKRQKIVNRFKDSSNYNF
jgi:hypothetical protein